MKLRFFSRLLVFGLGASLGLVSQPARAEHADKDKKEITRPWVFFDLGNTLIDTRGGYHELRYLPGALEHVKALGREGYRLGLLVNIPGSWGRTYLEKIERLKTFVAVGWKSDPPFAWDLFDWILVPMADAQRKPALNLFLQAMGAAFPCPILFEADLEALPEEPEQTEIARGIGFAVHVVNPSAPVYPSPESVDELLRKSFSAYDTSQCGAVDESPETLPYGSS